jgi:1-acyl-sn-glycerol-3-phosphate acyltransferase
MHILISFTMLSFIKLFATLFYRFKINWLSETKGFDQDIRLIAVLNHTSLYEPLLISVAPYRFLWRAAKKLTIPVADKTMKRPIVGKFFKFLMPGIISVTRKRDKSWSEFLRAIENECIVMILPEGRMKRINGLDSKGKPMDVKSGVTDIIGEMHEGKILFAYSGGLHHIQHPGELRPKLFKTIKLNLELVDIQSYKSNFQSEGIQFKREIVADMNHRLASLCP